MTNWEACQKYPLPEGELSRQQRGYYERMQALQGCAYCTGYNDAEKKAAEGMDNLRILLSENSIKKSELERQVRELKENRVAVLEKTIACIDSVKAMLEHTNGTMTHRERNFCSQAIIKYIDSIRNDLKLWTDPIPF